ncbi:hypothetical protein [uncultured Shimia sp.]|uniref:hypothetical protein n=1 Tax=uncultured Shimia sp. TaxID=573152 RepID=UPI002632FE62|nr:hypothetical protein [uncultured Shimia sp.]
MDLLQKSQNLLGAITAAVILMSASLAGAQTPVTYTEHGKALFQVKVPDFWSVRVGGPRTLSPSDDEDTRNVSRVLGMQPEAADNIWVGFIVPDGVRNLEEGADYVRDIGPQLLGEAEVTKREVRRIGGRTAHSITGKGRRNGKGVQFTALLIDLPGPRVAFSVTVLQDGFDPDLLGGINSIYSSFRVAQ